MAYPFELTPSDLDGKLDQMVDAVWSALGSYFWEIPRGPGFVTYERFASAYDALCRSTHSFRRWDMDSVWKGFLEDNLVLVVVRAILGISPPEWVQLAFASGGQNIKPNSARALDRKVRADSPRLTRKEEDVARILLASAVKVLASPAPVTEPSRIHRLDKVDTQDGIRSAQHLSSAGVPYAMLLYERFLGRPFASLRDSTSELVGDLMEGPIEQILTDAGVPYRKTKRAEKVPGFDQAPDFIIPDEWRPRVVIEAKVTEDGGTARDKVTRIQHLRELADEREREGKGPVQVVACIDGWGFGERREDMRKLLRATDGKVFTLKTLPYLVSCTELARFATPKDNGRE